MYEGFVRLFKNIEQLDFNGESDAHSNLRKWFKYILIDTCIEDGKSETKRLKNLSDWDTHLLPVIRKLTTFLKQRDN